MRCHYCEWRCELGVDHYGRCRMYYAEDGTVKERFPDRWSTYETVRIESTLFYHVKPGSQCLVIGTSSCNFSCNYCSNAFVAKQDPACQQDNMYQLSAQRLVTLARKLKCTSIVFDVNEPTVSLPSLQRLATQAHAAGITLGCLTNGYGTPEATELLASVFSFFNISLKGLDDEFHRRYIGIPTVKPILRNIEALAAQCHVEITTPVIQGLNDHELDEIVAFIAGIDREIPWHVLRLLPEDGMKGAVYPNIDKINRELEQARRVLPYLYFHNFVGSEWVNTLCPDCGAPVIERFSLGCGGDQLQQSKLDNGCCSQCHRRIKIYEADHGKQF